MWAQMFSVAVDCVSQDELCCASKEHGYKVLRSVLLARGLYCTFSAQVGHLMLQIPQPLQLKELVCR